MTTLRMPIEQQESRPRILPGPESGWLTIGGELDVWNVGALRDALDVAHLDCGDVHLDVSGLLFCDVTGISVIVAAAGRLGDGRRLLLHGLDPQLQKVFRVVGWSGMPSLVIDADRVYAG